MPFSIIGLNNDNICSFMSGINQTEFSLQNSINNHI